MLGDGTNHMESLVVLERRANVEAMASLEVPRQAGVRIVVYDDQVADGADGGDVEVERVIEVFPCGSEGGDGGLAEEVE